MIISVQVLYRAEVVHVGHRKPEDCLLSVDVPVRIVEASPPLAITMEDDTTTYGEGALPINWAMMDGPAAWYEHEGQLLGEFRQVLWSPPDRRPTRYRVEMSAMNACCQRRDRYIPRSRGNETHPFITPAALGTPLMLPFRGTDGLPVYPETMEFRSRTPINGDVRDIAMAHAQNVARSMIFHSEVEELLTPSIGPVIFSESRPIVVRAYVPQEEFQRARPEGGRSIFHSALELEEALTFSRALSAGLPDVPSVQNITVLRPDSVTWDSAATSLAACGATLGMAWGSTARMPNGRAGGDVFPYLQRLFQAFDDDQERNFDILLRKRRHFTNILQPSRDALEISHHLVQAALADWRAAAMDFSTPERVADPKRLVRLQSALDRTSHLGLGTAAGLAAAGINPSLLPGADDRNRGASP